MYFDHVLCSDHYDFCAITLITSVCLVLLWLCAHDRLFVVHVCVCMVHVFVHLCVCCIVLRHPPRVPLPHQSPRR